jgi:AAA15 family ATPase/GTPase
MDEIQIKVLNLQKNVMYEGIKALNISNFKSIKSLQMPCKRLNIFIGEPNVGKSNILEALSLLGGTFSQTKKFLSDFIRSEQIDNLFYDNDLDKIINVSADDYCAILRHHSNNIDLTDYIVGKKWINELVKITEDITKIESKFRELKLENPDDSSFEAFYVYFQNGKFGDETVLDKKSFFRKYDYKKGNFSASKFSHYLIPPFGSNLFHILMNNQELKYEIKNIFQQRGLDVVFSKTDNTIELQKRDDDDYIYKYPFANTADTFQRLLFFLAIIESNKNAVLILEEPEVHSFPPYTTQLAERILQDTDNQYFITTHSPYFLGKLVEKADFKDINICITYFENFQTKVKILNEAELQEVVDYGTDLFFNLNKLLLS